MDHLIGLQNGVFIHSAFHFNNTSLLAMMRTKIKQNISTYLFTPVLTPTVLNNPVGKHFLKQGVCCKKIIIQRNERTVTFNSKILPVPPKMNPSYF
jgi:hypothetical protein